VTTNQRRRGWVVFSDFDGTMTDRDLVVALGEAFGGGAARRLIADMETGRRSLKDGLERLYALLPTADRPRYVDFVRQEGRLRAGVKPTVAAWASKGIPFYVLSTGLDAFVTPLLTPWVPTEHIYCNRADWSGERLAVDWPFLCHPPLCQGHCGFCKLTVMNWLTPPGWGAVLVGDGLTDALAARVADVVIARGGLAGRLERWGRPYLSFETFDDVAEHVDRVLAGAPNPRRAGGMSR
jgi:2-hydroxy-3-keto-5-methylthiopentenyl-1-phosphate phosphatase